MPCLLWVLIFSSVICSTETMHYSDIAGTSTGYYPGQEYQYHKGEEYQHDEGEEGHEYQYGEGEEYQHDEGEEGQEYQYGEGEESQYHEISAKRRIILASNAPPFHLEEYKPTLYKKEKPKKKPFLVNFLVVARM
uniref:Uncharacterized protein n=1 Tax=Meloidogyne enterolobii TaxID=390850 RepID=A0A6V7TTG3_MELEN|nr:unnamed protein product [Meloidogyne enterolobii]